jgi:hypothetical protein
MAANPSCIKDVVDTLRLVLKGVLHTQGTGNQYFLGYKDYVTFVGVKQALFWCQPYEGDIVQLFAEYDSCGHNVLSTTSELIKFGTPDDAVQSTCNTFLRRVDEIVSDTYAMRLMKTNS